MFVVENGNDASDLPERLPPMLVKELRQGLRRGVFLVPFIGIHVLAVAAMYQEFLTKETLGYERYTGVMQLLLFFDKTPFWWVVGGICVVAMPLGALGLMQSEIEEGNYELLQVAGLSRWQVVLGKFFSIWSICMLTFSSLLPYMVLRYFVGGIDVWRNVAMSLTVVCMSALVSAFALASSAYETIVKRGVVLLLLFVSAIVSWGIMLISADTLNGCGLFYHFNMLLFVCYYVYLSLMMARSRIRLTHKGFEVRPSRMLILLLIFTPIVAGIAAFVTLGRLPGLGLLVMGYCVFNTDEEKDGRSYKVETLWGIQQAEKAEEKLRNIGNDGGERLTAEETIRITAPPVPFAKGKAEEHEGWR